MFRLIAEKEGETVVDYGEFLSLDKCRDKIAEVDGPDPMENPQWPEGCDAVAYSLGDCGTVGYLFECDAWSQFETGEL